MVSRLNTSNAWHSLFFVLGMLASMAASQYPEAKPSQVQASEESTPEAAEQILVVEG